MHICILFTAQKVVLKIVISYINTGGCMVGRWSMVDGLYEQMPEVLKLIKTTF